VSDPFGEFERAGWSAGRAEPYHQAIGAITREAIPRLLDAAGVGAGTRLLDVATGPGYAAAAAAARGAAATGVDFSAEMVALAQRLHPDAEFAQADAQALPFADGGFDLVAAIELLEHVEDPVRALAELARVAGSHLLVSVPREPLWRALNVARGAYVRDLGNTPGHRHHWSRRSFVELLERHGEVVQARAPLPWTMALVRL
jgi:SAM-dependent methyltransferase